MSARLSPTPRQAGPAEVLQALELLQSQKLPTEGLEALGELFVIQDEAGRVLGCALLETHGHAGLLRSLAVASSARGMGLGAALVNAVIRRARAKNLSTLSLLTMTAEDYFPRFGFRKLERSQLSADLDASTELRGACPASALAMRLELADMA